MAAVTFGDLQLLHQATLRELVSMGDLHKWVNMTPKQREQAAYDSQFEEWKKSAILPVTAQDLANPTTKVVG